MKLNFSETASFLLCKSVYTNSKTPYSLELTNKVI